MQLQHQRLDLPFTILQQKLLTRMMVVFGNQAQTVLQELQVLQVQVELQELAVHQVQMELAVHQV
jgi:hypothetical protein